MKLGRSKFRNKFLEQSLLLPTPSKSNEVNVVASDIPSFNEPVKQLLTADSADKCGY